MPTLVLCELADASHHGVESYSPFCLKVHRALKWSGLPYERRYGTSGPASFRKLNPTGQVPVLIVDGEAVPDSTRIIERLAAISRRPMYPATVREKAECVLWEELADTSLNGFLVAARWVDARNWPITRDAYFEGMPALLRRIIPAQARARIFRNLHARDVIRAGEPECWRRFTGMLDALDARAPTRGFWLGEQPCAADFALFGQLWSLTTPLTAWQGAQLQQRTRLHGYLARVNAATLSPSDVVTEARAHVQ